MKGEPLEVNSVFYQSSRFVRFIFFRSFIHSLLIIIETPYFFATKISNRSWTFETSRPKRLILPVVARDTATTFFLFYFAWAKPFLGTVSETPRQPSSTTRTITWSSWGTVGAYAFMMDVKRLFDQRLVDVLYTKRSS